MIKPLLTAAALFLSAFLIYHVFENASEIARLSPQSHAMIEGSHSLHAALRPSAYPPGYPLLLFLAQEVRISPAHVNLGLFYLTIFLIFIVSKKSFQNIHPVWLPLFYSLCAFNYYNLSEITSEAAVVPLSLLTLLFLAAYQRRQSLSAIVSLSLSCALLFATRFLTPIWLTPIILCNLMYSWRTQRKSAWRHLPVFLIIAFTPLIAVLAANYSQTGYLTGMDRFSWSSRHRPASFVRFASSIGLNDNILLTLKTYLIDFASPFEFATHGVNQSAHSLSSVEMGAIALFVWAAGVLAFVAVRTGRKPYLTDTWRAWRDASPISLLALEFFGGYILTTVTIWTIANNDPLYTRFLYPSYLYFMIVLFAGYSFLKRVNCSGLLKAPFMALFAYLIVINLYKLALFAQI